MGPQGCDGGETRPVCQRQMLSWDQPAQDVPLPIRGPGRFQIGVRFPAMAGMDRQRTRECLGDRILRCEPRASGMNRQRDEQATGRARCEKLPPSSRLVLPGGPVGWGPSSGLRPQGGFWRAGAFIVLGHQRAGASSGIIPKVPHGLGLWAPLPGPPKRLLVPGATRSSGALFTRTLPVVGLPQGRFWPVFFRGPMLRRALPDPIQESPREAPRGGVKRWHFPEARFFRKLVGSPTESMRA